MEAQPQIAGVTVNHNDEKRELRAPAPSQQVPQHRPRVISDKQLRYLKSLLTKALGIPGNECENYLLTECEVTDVSQISSRDAARMISDLKEQVEGNGKPKAYRH